LQVNSKNASVNNENKKLELPAQVINNRTMVPIRFISEALGMTVNWDDKNNSVVLTSGKEPEFGLEYDSGNLRANADFKVEVAPGINWVPAVTLGKPKLTNDEIVALKGKDPEVIQKTITNVYDLIRYIRLTGFMDPDSYGGTRVHNQYIKSNDGSYTWYYNRPALSAIKIGEGNCGAISNVVNYVLKDNYEEIGYICDLQNKATEGGHVWIYIKMNGKYYFMDFTEYPIETFEHNIAKETGDIFDYQNSNKAAGNIHEANSIEDYVNYYYSNANNSPEVFYWYKADSNLPIGIKYQNQIVSELYLPKDCNIGVKSFDSNIKINYATPPDGSNLKW